MNRHASSRPDIEAYKLMSSGRLAEALPLAERATAGTPVCVPAHGMLARILFQLGRRGDAEAVVTKALKLQQGTADAYDALAHVSMMLGQHERSNSIYRRVVAIEPNDPRFWYNLASSERSVGRLLEAEAACDRAISLDKTHYASYLLRSELRVQSREANHVEELSSELARRNLGDNARMFLGYALAKELDDLRRFDEAFQCLAEAASLRRRHLAYDVRTDQRKLCRIEEVFPTTFYGLPSDDGASSRYIFIVGLPRSGTTLLEHILMGLPGVRSNGETDNFSQALLASLTPGQTDVFAGAAAADPAVVAARYETLAAGDSADDKIIEKLPMNYLYLGAIRRALPGSKLVLVNRQPIDSCFAMYRTLFGEAYPFSYDFEDLATYYAAYDRLVSHWETCFGKTLYAVAYEDLVADPARTAEGVANYCGLEWNARALDFHERSSVSFTASAAQVRRPIYRSSSGRWRNYRRHLGPLIRALQSSHIHVADHN